MRQRYLRGCRHHPAPPPAPPRAAGFKFGIYSDAGLLTCGGYPGSLGHEGRDAKLFASWGVGELSTWPHGQAAGPAAIWTLYSAAACSSTAAALQHAEGRGIAACMQRVWLAGAGARNR